MNNQRFGDSKVVKVIEKGFYIAMVLVIAYMVYDGFSVLLAVSPK